MAGSAPVVVRTLAFLVLRRILAWLVSIELPMLTMWRSRCCGIGSPCYAGRWPGPATHPPIVLATLAKLLPRDRWKIFLVTPSTLLRWHRELVRRRWIYPATGRRRGLDWEVVGYYERCGWRRTEELQAGTLLRKPIRR